MLIPISLGTVFALIVAVVGVATAGSATDAAREFVRRALADLAKDER